jgi:hypothetical protein
MREADFRSLYLCEPQPLDHRLFDLATEYYDRTESYDLTVCSGPVTRDGIMPASSRELNLINRNAHAVRKEIEQKAALLGFGLDELRGAMRIHSRRT